MRYVDETMLHLLDGPRQQFVKRARYLEIEIGEFAPEPRHVDPGDNGTFGHPAIGVHQFAREEIVDALALGRRWKQRGRARAGLYVHFQFVSRSFLSRHCGYASSDNRDSIVRPDSDSLRGIGRMGTPRAVARLTSILYQVRQPIRVETHGGQMPVMR